MLAFPHGTGIYETASRKNALEQDPRGLVPGGHYSKSNPLIRDGVNYGSVEGHEEQFRGQQNALQDAINRYKDRCRGPNNPDPAPALDPRFQGMADRPTPNAPDLSLGGSILSTSPYSYPECGLG